MKFEFHLKDDGQLEARGENGSVQDLKFLVGWIGRIAGLRGVHVPQTPNAFMAKFKPSQFGFSIARNKFASHTLHFNGQEFDRLRCQVTSGRITLIDVFKNHQIIATSGVRPVSEPNAVPAVKSVVESVTKSNARKRVVRLAKFPTARRADDWFSAGQPDAPTEGEFDVGLKLDNRQIPIVAVGRREVAIMKFLRAIPEIGSAPCACAVNGYHVLDARRVGERMFLLTPVTNCRLFLYGKNWPAAKIVLRGDVERAESLKPETNPSAISK